MSRFVSAGTVDEPKPVEDVPVDDEWEKARQQVQEGRQRKQETGRQEGGKTLYEVLQANKAAKQDAFEEASRLKNQFRALDDDEVEFLDTVLETTRAKDASVKREILEQLETFRRQQEDAAKAERDQTGPIEEEVEEQWANTGRKRKKGREKEPLKGIKLRKSSSSAANEGPAESKPEDHNVKGKASKSPFSATIVQSPTMKSGRDSGNPLGRPAVTDDTVTEAPGASVVSEKKPTQGPGLGLGGYGSSDED